MDGSEGVQAEIDRAGTLAFNTFSGNHGSATRWFNFDFGHPVDSSNGFVPRPYRELSLLNGRNDGARPVGVIAESRAGGLPTTQCGYMGNSSLGTAARTTGSAITRASRTRLAVRRRSLSSPGYHVGPAVWTVGPSERARRAQTWQRCAGMMDRSCTALRDPVPVDVERQ